MSAPNASTATVDVDESFPVEVLRKCARAKVRLDDACAGVKEDVRSPVRAALTLGIASKQPFFLLVLDAPQAIQQDLKDQLGIADTLVAKSIPFDITTVQWFPLSELGRVLQETKGSPYGCLEVDLARIKSLEKSHVHFYLYEGGEIFLMSVPLTDLQTA